MVKRMLSSLLNQKLLPTNIIVIDDASPMKIDLSDFIHKKVQLEKSKKRHGPAFSRNLGARIALEEGFNVIVFSDYDLFFPRNWIWILNQALRQNSGDLLSGVNLAFGETWWDWYHEMTLSLWATHT